MDYLIYDIALLLMFALTFGAIHWLELHLKRKED